MSDDVEDFSINNPNVSRETMKKLSIFRAFLLEENQKTNLIAKSQKDKIWMRHIHDSLRILALLEGKEPINILDIGSGGGFPGIPLAIATKNLDIQYTLIESIRKKSAFLESCKRHLGLNYKIYTKPISEISGLNIDYITARAFAPIEKIINVTKNIIHEKTIYVLLKGKSYLSELKFINSKKYSWQNYPSITSDESKIVVMGLK